MDRKGDELADLSGTLNQTAAQLDATIRTLTEERNQSAAVLSSMAEGVVVIGPNQRVIFCNAAFRRAVNIENAAWEGRPVVEVIPNADLLGYIEQMRTGDASVTSELVVGSVRTKNFAVTVTPIRSDGTHLRIRDGAARHHRICAGWNARVVILPRMSPTNSRPRSPRSRDLRKHC